MGGLRLYAAPGESPDLLEFLETSLSIEEVVALDQAEPGEDAGVLFLSRSLASGATTSEWASLPAHVAVIASDSDARGEAEKADRLFLSLEDLRGGADGMARMLRAAARYSRALLAAR